MTLDARIEQLSPSKQKLLSMMRERDGTTVYPLSYAQQRLWFMNQLQPWNTAYNVLRALRLRGVVSVSALEHALSELVRRHETLRTRFDDRDGQVVQRIGPPFPVALAQIDLTGTSGADWQAHTQAIADEEMARPFDLRRGPMLRATLARFGAEDYVCVLAMHHIVCDGWSSRILARDVMQFYTAAVEGRAPQLPPLEIQYGQYAAWERRRLEPSRANEHLAYWRAHLTGMDVLRLPVDREPAGERRYEGAREDTQVASDVGDMVRTLAARSGSTVFMILLAAYQIVLARWSGQEDVVVGTDVANRNRKELEPLVGFFINQLVLRTRVSETMTIRALLAAVRTTALEAFAHQDVPFERIVEELKPERTLHQSPLFPAKLIMRNFPTVVAAGGHRQVSVEPVQLETTRAQIDLVLSAFDSGSNLKLSLVYSTAVYDAVTIRRFLGHMTRVLGQLLDAYDRRVGDLDLLDDAERRQLIAQADGPQRPVAPVSRSLTDAVAAHAALRPDAVAVTCGNVVLTYAALVARAGRVAATLRALGVGPEVRVGLCAVRGVAQIVGLLGIVQAGGTYVPLDPSYPTDRLTWQAEDAGIAVLVTERAWRDRVATRWTVVVELESTAASGPVALAPTEVRRDHAAYVLYTSGSTGRPKGVEVTHGNLQNYVAWAAAAYAVTPGMSVPFHTQLAFDLSVTSVWVPLVAGARIDVVPEADGLTGLAALLGRAGPALLKLTPAHLRGLMVLGAAGACARGSTLVIGGEALGTSDVNPWHPQARTINEYGPTEATVGCSTYDAHGGEAGAYVPIGRPIENARLRVLTPRMMVTPVGVAGELYIGGSGVARGYCNRPALTADRFRPDPLGAAWGERLYATGDRARWLNDGNLEYLGRSDDQVQLRGYRIEPGEIEAVLREQPEVAEAAVAVRMSLDGHPHLVGYVTNAPAATVPSCEELTTRLRERLPSYMVPSAIVQVTDIPLTVNGKIDRARLAALEQAAPAPREYTPPRGAVEDILCGIVAYVLKREHVGIDDHFFELGGDSLLSLQVVARARAAGLSLSVEHIFEAPTVRGLAPIAAQCDDAADAAARVAPEGEMPLTPIQRWFFQHPIEPRSHWNQSVLLRTGPLHAHALEGIVRRLITHHDALRLRFGPGRDGQWRQWYDSQPPRGALCATVDLAGLSAGARRALLERAADRVQRSLSLEHGPVVRFVWFRLDEAEGRLLAVAHHLVVDAVSWRILIEDLQNAHEAVAARRPIALPPRTASYGRWAQALTRQVGADWLHAEAEFWKSVAARGSGWRLPRDYESDTNHEHTVETAVVSAHADETQWLLQDLRRIHGAQIHEVLIAALARSVATWIGRSDVLLELDGHGRQTIPGGVDVSRTVGWFTALYPLCIDVDLRAGPIGALRAAVDRIRSVPRGGIGYGMLRYLASDRDVAVDGGRAIAFNYLGQFDQVLRSAAWSAAAEAHGHPRPAGARRTHDLAITAAVRGGRLHLEWSYSRTQFRRQTIEAVAENWLAELRALVSALAVEPPLSLPERPETRVATPHPARSRSRPAAAPASRPERVPLSYAQQRIWFLDQLKGSTPEYNITESLRLVGPLDVHALAWAITTIVARHEILRTRFVAVDGRACQIVEPAAPVPVPLVDLTALSTAARRAVIVAAIRGEGLRAFDLARGPLLRVFVFVLEERDHVLLRVVHHMVSDRWSQGIFSREFSALYTSCRTHQPNPLPPLPLQYSDFAVSQRAALDAGAMAAGVAYWKQQLAGIPTRLELPTDSSRPAIQTFAGAACHVVVSRDQVAGLKRLAIASHATLYMTLLASFGALLSRYTGQTDFVVGTSLANRQDPQLEKLIGLFVNNVVLRLRPTPSLHFDALLAAVRQAAIEAYRYQDVPFEQIVDELSPDRTLSATPIYQVMFGLQNTPWEERRLDAMQVQVLPGPELHVHLDLEVLAIERDGELSIAWYYNRDLFDAWRIEQMARHYVRMLAAFVDDPHAIIGRVNLLDATEARRLLEEWNDTAHPVARTTLPRLFESQARRTPDAVAVVAAEARLSYRAVNRRANRLARLLRDAGVGLDDVIALALPRSLDLLVATLAVMKAGAAYLPLDPSLPPARLTDMLDDTRPRFILTTSAVAPHVPVGDGCRAFALDDPVTIARLDRSPGDDAADGVVRLDPQNVAYVLYTSGSTGRPKGVTIAQQGAVELLDAYSRRADVGGADVSALFHAMTFDLSLCEAWAPLLRGGCVVVVPLATSRSPADFVALLTRHQVTVICQTPTELYQLVQADSERAGAGARLALRTIVSGGEALESSRLRAWTAGAGSGVTVINFYGPSEVTVGVTMHVVGERDLAEGAAPIVPIGRPLANYRIYVLDSRLTPVPLGVEGELFVAATALARSYWNRPALTAERFVPSPFGQFGERLYRTGDRGRWLPDGTLTFLGRSDDQVKLRGIRIEPGEIEMALLQQPGVRQAAVVVREDEPGNKRLIAYVIASADAGSASVLRARLQAVLPNYMVPAAVVRLDRLPLMPSGKLDRRALPAPDPIASRDRADVIHPRDATEAYVKQVWQEVLGVGDLDVRDNFFTVGGHSMNSVVVMSRVSRLYGRAVSVAAIFQYPTIEQFAAFLRQEVALQPPSAIVPIQPRGTRPPLFLVHPAGGLATVYVELSRELGVDQPLYAFESRGLHHPSSADETIEAMARDYVSELKTVVPEGPWLLGGWSMGGVVAYEMARQLVAAGERVALLALLDTIPQRARRRRRRGAPRPIPAEALSTAQQHRLETLLAAMKQSARVPPDLTVQQYRRFRQLFARNIRAERAYRYRSYAGSITLVSTRINERDPTRGWRRLASEPVVVHCVEAPHHELAFAPHAASVAAILREAIDGVMRAGLSTSHAAV